MKTFIYIFFIWGVCLFSFAASAQSWFSCITPTSVHINSLTEWDSKLIIGGFGPQGRYILSYDGSAFDTIGIIDDPQPSVWALCDFNGELYVGGDFQSINGIIVNGIAKFDGNTWYPLGTGLGGISNPRVAALHVYNNELVVGGEFNSVNGITAKNIAKWNGVAWDSLGPGFNGDVSALGVYQNEIYAGGIFRLSGLDTVNNIAKWNGINWQPLLHGMDPYVVLPATEVFAIQEFQNTLYIGGRFDYADTLLSRGIACWNGTNWSAGPINLYNPVTDFELYNNKLFIGGFFIDSQNNIHFAASWDGTALDNMNAGLIGTSGIKEVWDMEVYNNRIYYGGNIYSNASMNVISVGLIVWDEFNSLVTSNGSVHMLNVSPNPANNEIKISTERNGPYDCTITDSSGRIVLTKTINKNERINIDRLEDGFYSIRLSNKLFVDYEHFIITH